jgi:SPP1 family predicted phage head-tail adaptor
MNPGKLEIYGYIEQDIGAAKNASGETIEDWKVLTPVWLERIAKAGKEIIESDQIVGIVSDTFRLRYDPSIKQKMRLIISGVVYRIISVNYFNRQYMTIDTEKRDNEIYAT